MSAVVCEQLSKRYDGKLALQEMNITIPKGTVTGILGPNGSGKSTLFRLIMGMIQPTSGKIRVLDKVPGWQLNAEIAYLPDRASWYPHQRVSDVIAWGELHLPGFNRDLALDLLDFMKIKIDMPTSGMSKGEEARMLLTLCIAREVPLLILDEPFSGIDLTSREKIISSIIDIVSQREQTVLISTHEIYETEALFEYVVFLEQGSVRLEGYAEELRSKHGSIENIYRQLYR